MATRCCVVLGVAESSYILRRDDTWRREPCLVSCLRNDQEQLVHRQLFSSFIRTNVGEQAAPDPFVLSLFFFLGHLDEKEMLEWEEYFWSCALSHNLSNFMPRVISRSNLRTTHSPAGHDGEIADPRSVRKRSCGVRCQHQIRY